MILKKERELEREEATWKVRLEERKKELEEMEKKWILNREEVCSVGGVIKLEILKEMEVEHNSKIDKLTQEVSAVNVDNLFFMKCV